jgi:hypothetical protein
MLSTSCRAAGCGSGHTISVPRRNIRLGITSENLDFVASAFAAELLAPADGIRRILDELGSSDDNALEAVARHFEVSPLLVRYLGRESASRLVTLA